MSAVSLAERQQRNGVSYMYRLLTDKIKQYIQVKNNDIHLIEALFRERILAKGDLFLQEGKLCRELGFINKGLVCYHVLTDGNKLVHNFAKENEFVCNFDSLIKKTASQKNIMALERTELLVISWDQLQRLYTTMSNGEKFGRLLMEEVYTDAIKHIISFYTESPQKRYNEFVEKHKELALRVPQYYIASFIGVKPQSLSRIRKRMMTS